MMDSLSKKAMGIYLDYADDLESLDPDEELPNMEAYLEECPRGERENLREILEVWKEVFESDHGRKVCSQSKKNTRGSREHLVLLPDLPDRTAR